MTPQKKENPGVTLTDTELCQKVDAWVTKLCKSGGRDWSLSVPVNFNRDPDMLISELVKRFKALTDQPQLSRSVLEEVRERCSKAAIAFVDTENGEVEDIVIQYIENGKVEAVVDRRSIRNVNIYDLLPAGDGWIDISNYPDNGPVVQRWHKIYKCIVSVYLKPGVSTLQGCDWVTGTLDHTWPELAFEPFFKPLPTPPQTVKDKE